MNCILIENFRSENNISNYLEKIPYFKLLAICTSVFEAYQLLQEKQVELIFIESEVNKISGLDFIKSLNVKPLVVILSSDSELAVEAFNINALDFLLKPISFERFLITVNKAIEKSALRKNKTHDLSETNKNNFVNKSVLIKTEYKNIFIRLEDILYIEGLKDYIKIYTSVKEKPVLTLNSLKNFEQQLPSENFSRIHKSFIVGLDHINAINKNQVIINDKFIPIGESYRTVFSEKMAELRI